MKTQLLFSVLVASGVQFIPAASTFAESEAKDVPPSLTINTGALVPLTGSAAEQGQWILDGLRLGAERAKREFNVTVNLKVEETAADPKRAITAYRALRSGSDAAQKPNIVFTYGSGVGVALSPLTNEEHVIQFGLATASPAYRSLDDYSFRNFPSAEVEAEFLANTVLTTLKSKRVAILRIQNEFGAGTSKAFRTVYEAKGGLIVA